MKELRDRLTEEYVESMIVSMKGRLYKWIENKGEKINFWYEYDYYYYCFFDFKYCYNKNMKNCCIFMLNCHFLRQILYERSNNSFVFKFWEIFQ